MQWVGLSLVAVQVFSNPMACGILEPVTPCFGKWILNQWTIREVTSKNLIEQKIGLPQAREKSPAGILKLHGTVGSPELQGA